MRWKKGAPAHSTTGVESAISSTRLAEVAYRQVTLKTWFEMFPQALVMQADPSAVRDERIDLEGEVRTR